MVSPNPENWTPNVDDGWVASLARVGNTYVAGGSFTRVYEPSSNPVYLERNNIFAFSSTGAIDPDFQPDIPGEIFDIASGRRRHQRLRRWFVPGGQR